MSLNCCTVIKMSFYIVATYPHNNFLIGNNLAISEYDMCSFRIENDYIIRCSDNKYLYWNNYVV